MNILVSHKETAIKLAEIYIGAIYGTEAAENQKPYIINDTGNSWVVRGKPPATLGGSFKIEINKKDGKVVALEHDR